MFMGEKGIFSFVKPVGRMREAASVPPGGLEWYDRGLAGVWLIFRPRGGRHGNRCFRPKNVPDPLAPPNDDGQPMNTSQPPRNIVVLVVDRLHSGFLGAYGNTWIQTPNFDSLAADAFLFDRAVIDSPRPDRFYRSCWYGWHALAQQAGTGRLQPALARQLADAGYVTTLLTDEPWLDDHPAAGGFARREVVAPLLGPDEDRLAASIDETHWARFFAAAIGELAVVQEPFCLWLHTGLLGQLWDAPLELRDQYRDEDDPRSADSADVPDRRLPMDFDPDELLAIVHAYAGQVSLLDLFLGGLLDGSAGLPAAANTLLAVVSARGFPLGEHGRIGGCDDALYAELTHIPLLLRLPNGRGASDRTQALVQPPDLHATLLDWCGQPAARHASPAFGKSLLAIVEGGGEGVRDRACTIASPEERAIVTSAWSMRLGAGASGGSRGTRDRGPADATEAAVELFTKPDDWFEVNEVSDRCGEVATEMEQAFLQFEQASQTAAPVELPPLPQALASGLD